MNKAYDYNGTVVSTSKPVRELRTVKKTLLIDSADRDTTKYYTNGDVVYYLPRVYENVVSIRLKSATFPNLNQGDSVTGALEHKYSDGKNIQSANWSSDNPVGRSDNTNTQNYFLIEIEGLNKTDETTVDGQRSTYPDSFYARIPVSLQQSTIGSLNYATQYFIEYNDNTHEENKTCYSPPLGKLDRLHIMTRLHYQQDKSGFIYWTNDGLVADSANQKYANYSLMFEIEMMDNSFDTFSSFETRLSTRGDTSNGLGHFGC